MRILTVAEYAEKHHITRIGVHDRIATKKVVAFKVGDGWLIIEGKNNIGLKRIKK